MNKKLLQVLFVFFLVLFAFNFFGAHFLNDRLVHYVNFFFCLTAVGMGLPFAFIKGKLFELPVQLIAFSVLFSTLMAFISWQQDLVYSLQVTVPALLWLFFFWLWKVKFPVKILEGIIVIYACVYIVLYLFQFFYRDTILFGTLFRGTGFYFSREVFRIVFPGGGVFFLAVFMAVNKITTEKTGRVFWILLAAVGLVITVMQVTRTYILAVLVIYLYHFATTSAFVKKMQKGQKIALISIICAALLLLFTLDIPVFQGLAKAQEATAKEGLENVRLTAAGYFLKDFSPNLVSNLLGNGIPAAPDQSYYGKYVANLYTHDKYMEDVGIIGFFAMFGIIAVIGYVMIWIKSFTKPVPAQYVYTKYYLWFLLITGFTWDTVYSNYYLITTVFALYIFQSAYTEEKMKGSAPVSKYKYNYRYGTQPKL